jgi:hypothetical protein
MFEAKYQKLIGGFLLSRISTSEMLQLRELLQMETNSVAKAKATMSLIQDDELMTLAKSGIQATEARIKGIQKFVSDNNIVTAEVH